MATVEQGEEQQSAPEREDPRASSDAVIDLTDPPLAVHLRVLRRSGWWIAAAVVLGLGLATAFVLSRAELFTATRSILLAPAVAEADADPLDSALFAPDEDDRRVANQVAIIETRELAAEALKSIRRASELDQVDDLLDRLDVNQRPGTSVLDISVSDASPTDAAELANAVGDAYRQARPAMPDGGVAYDLERATAPRSPSGLSDWLILASGGIGGMLLGLAIAYGRAQLTRSV